MLTAPVDWTDDWDDAKAVAMAVCRSLACAAAVACTHALLHIMMRPEMTELCAKLQTVCAPLCMLLTSQAQACRFVGVCLEVDNCSGIDSKHSPGHCCWWPLPQQ